MATKRPNDSDDHVGGIDGCGKTYIQGAKRQKTLDEYNFETRDIPKIQGDKEITPREENMHVGEVTKGDNFQNHNINSEKDQSKSGDYEYSYGREKGNVTETDKKSEQSHKDRSELKDKDYERSDKKPEQSHKDRSELKEKDYERSDKKPEQSHKDRSELKEKDYERSDKKPEQSHKDRSELKEKDYERSNAFKNRSHMDKESRHVRRSRSPGEKSRHSPKHRKHTKDKDSKSSSRSESTDEKSRHSQTYESRSKSEDTKGSNRRELTDEKSRNSYTHESRSESEQRSGKHEIEPLQKVEMSSPVKRKGVFKEEKSKHSPDNSYKREEKKKKLDHLKFDKFEHTEDLKDSHQNESPKDKSKHSEKHRQPTKDEDSGRSHRIESPDKKSSHSHKSEYKPTPKHCDTTKDDFEFFFGTKSPFSQFHPATFAVRGLKYNCAEQFMMHQKAEMFKDRQIAQQILSELKPLKQKRLGRKVRGFDPNVWGMKCVEIVKEGNIAKFSQNPHLEKQLIATYPKTMAECSPRDCLWGIGLGANNEKAWNVKTWRGKNLLGFALMEVRKHIMKTKGLIK